MPVRQVEVAFLGNTKQLEAALTRAGLVADTAGSRIGGAFSKGAEKAGGALSKLSEAGASFGLPFMGSLEKIGQRLDAVQTKTGKFSAALSEAGKVALVGGAAGFVAAGAEAVKLGEKFQTSTASIQANAGITEAAAKRLGQAFLDTAGHSAFSAQQMAQAYAAVAGQLRLTEGHALSTAEAMKFMGTAQQLAEATGQSLATTTSAVSQVMQGYHLSVDQAAQASDVLYNVSNALHIPVDAVAQAMNRLHGRLGVLAPSMRDVASLMVELAGKGVTGMRGISVVSTALNSLIGGSKNTKAVLKDLGVSIFDAHGRFIGLQGVISQLQPKMAGLSQQQRLLAAQMLFGKSAAQVMLQVVSGGASAYDRASQAATRLGSAHRAADAQANTLHHQMEVLRATVEDLGTKFGLYLIPKLTAVGHAIADVIHWFEKHKAAAQALAVVIAGILGAAVTKFATEKATAWIKSLSGMWGAMQRLGSVVSSTVSSIVGKFSAESTAAEANAAKVETANAAAGASFSETSTAASAAAATVEADVAAAATATEAADSAIVTANAAAAASFSSLIPVIGAAASAYLMLHQAINLPAGTSAAGVSSALNNAGAGFATSDILSQLTGQGAFGSITGSIGSTFSNIGSTINTKIGAALSKALAAAHGSIPSAAQVQAASPGLASLLAGGGAGGAGGGSGSGGRSAGASGRVIQVPANLSPNERQFVAYFAANTGLDPRVIAAWVQNEEGTRSSPLGHGDFNWLNVGWTDQGPVAGTRLPQWGTAAGAAQLTAQWMAGKGAMSSAWGPAAPGIRAILSTAGQGAGAQMSAINASGWASGGETLLRQLYAQSGGSTVGVSVGGSGSSSLVQRTAAVAVPTAVTAMLGVARALIGTRYTWGGGHSGWDPVSALKQIGVDCSGFVSQVLHAGGFLSSPQTTDTMPSAAGVLPGKGNWVTMWDRAFAGNSSHVIMQIAGHWFESGGSSQFNPSGGVSELSNAQAAGELSGGGFKPYHVNIPGPGPGSITSTGTFVPAPQVNIAQLIAQAIARYRKQLTGSANSLITGYDNLEQNGSIKGLEKALGFSSGARVQALGEVWGSLAPIPGTTSASGRLRQQFQAWGLKGMGGGGPWDILSVLGQATGGSSQGKAFDALVQQLRNAHDKALSKMADQLVAAHKAALTSLAQELYAEQVKADAREENLRAVQLRGQTQIQASMAQNAVQGIKDAMQSVTDVFTAQATAIKDQTQASAAAAQSKVQAIQDQSQITTDTLAERGLYGLNLVAQKQQVQLDQMKASYDGQIAQAQSALDAVQGSTDKSSAAAQAFLDAVQTKQNVLVGAAQVQLDNVTKSTDVAVQKAQDAVDKAATQSKAQQDVAAAALAKAQADQAMQVGQAQAALSAAQATADQTGAQAQALLASAQGNASVLIAQAQQTLQSVSDQASVAEAQQQAEVAKTTALAQTQFAGGGLNVYITGINPTDAAAVASEVGWTLRTRIPA